MVRRLDFDFAQKVFYLHQLGMKVPCPEYCSPMKVSEKTFTCPECGYGAVDKINDHDFIWQIYQSDQKYKEILRFLIIKSEAKQHDERIKFRYMSFLTRAIRIFFPDYKRGKK